MEMETFARAPEEDPGGNASGSLAKYGEDVRIYNHYTDRNRFLKVKVLCDLFNDMAELHTFIQKTDVATLSREGLTWMLRRIHLYMPCMPRREESVRIETWNPAFEGLLVPRVYRVEDAAAAGQAGTGSEASSGNCAERKLRAFAHTDWMLINTASRRPERPSTLMKGLAGHCAESLPFTDSLFTKAEHKSGPDASWTVFSSTVFLARYSDLDFNGHVTQSAYVQWMMDAHGFLFQERAELKEFEVIYVHELKPGGEVRVEVLRQDSGQGQAAAGAVAAAESRQGIAAAEEEAEEALLESAEGGETVLSYRVSSLDGSVVHAYGRGVWKKRLC